MPALRVHRPKGADLARCYQTQYSFRDRSLCGGPPPHHAVVFQILPEYQEPRSFMFFVLSLRLFGKETQHQQMELGQI
jgi:hypothetical protein